MIVDLDIGGVFIPGLLVMWVVSLIAAVLVIRLLAAAGLHRLVAHRALVELAVFAIIFSLLLWRLPSIGLFQ